MDMKELAELLSTASTALASPVVIAVFTWIYVKITKKKENEDKVRHLFDNVIATVKTIESELGKGPSTESGMDPRMERALVLFNNFRQMPSVQKACAKLKIDLTKLDDAAIRDVMEKLLHAKKIGMSFDVVRELENKLN